MGPVINRWPFNSLLDSRGLPTGWELVHSRVITFDQQELLAELRREGHRFVGMSSDGSFPLADRADPAQAADAIDYGEMCEAWCHCFRDPERYVPTNLPRALISDSDFVDFNRVKPEPYGAGKNSVPFDFVYVGAREEWKLRAKNWPLAERCIPLICHALGMRALVVGAPVSSSMASCPEVTQEPWLPWRDFLDHLSRARFLFLPNREDASPRVLAEALCLDTPAVVQRHILGGWKYVNSWTGVFFDDEYDVVRAVQECLSRPRSPRAWFRAHYGPYHSGRRLLALVLSVDPSISERSHLSLAGQVVPSKAGA
jgi:hypothetical protein